MNLFMVREDTNDQNYEWRKCDLYNLKLTVPKVDMDIEMVLSLDNEQCEGKFRSYALAGDKHSLGFSWMTADGAVRHQVVSWWRPKLKPGNDLAWC